MHPPPDKDHTDHAYAAAKIAAALVPAVGGGLAELLGAVFAAPVERRREQWLREMATAIDELFDRVDGLTPQRLRDNPAFVSICLQASQSALRSHQQEKLAALRAAIKNSVLMDDVDANRASLFVHLVDDLLPLHLRLLDVYANAEAHRERLQRERPGSAVFFADLAAVWDAYHPEMPAADPLVQLADGELRLRGLVAAPGLQVTVSADAKLTALGESFLAFISDAPVSVPCEDGSIRAGGHECDTDDAPNR